MINLSFVGTSEGLMEYLEEQTFACKTCKDTGVILKDEWVNDDDNYQIAVRCICTED